MTTAAPDPYDLFDQDERRSLPGRQSADEGLFGTLNDLAPDSDGALQIRSGGAVAVDTWTLRTTADRFVAAQVELDGIRLRLGSLQNMLLGRRDFAGGAASAAGILSARLLEVQTEAEAIAGALRGAAAVYEVVELDVQLRAAHAAGDPVRIGMLEARRAAVVAEHPDAGGQAFSLQYAFSTEWQHELVRQATRWGVGLGDELGPQAAVVGGAGVGALTFAGAAFLGLAGTGRLSRDARLSGTAGPVTVVPVSPAAPGGIPPVAPGGAGAGSVGSAAPSASRSPAAVAPQSLAAAAARIPGGGDSRVRVERYTMADGSTKSVVYIAGMQSGAVGGDEPWDNQSNVELYSGRTSDSYAATEGALAAAGIEPGDEVHVVAFSQGAMIGAHLALEGDYDVKSLVSLGSPVDADVGPGTISVAVRHSDDPVAGLAGGGHGEAVGAPGSFVAERVYDPASDLGDALWPAHRLAAYTETAALVDGSGDPRVQGVRGVFDELAAAESVEVSEYGATRG